MKRVYLLMALFLAVAALGWVTPPGGVDAGYLADHYLPLSGGEVGPLFLPHTNRLSVGDSHGIKHLEVYKGFQGSRAMSFLRFRDTLASVPVSTGYVYFTENEFHFTRPILAPSISAETMTIDDSLNVDGALFSRVGVNTARIGNPLWVDGDIRAFGDYLRAGDEDYGTGQGYLKLRDSVTDGDGVMRFYDTQIDVSWDGESSWHRFLHGQSPGDDFPDAVVKTSHVGNVSIDGNLAVKTNLVLGGGMDMQNSSISNINSAILLGTDVRRTSSSHWLSLMGGDAWDSGAHFQLGGDTLDSGSQVAFGGADLLLAQAAAHGFTIRERGTWSTLFHVKGDGTAQVHGHDLATTAWVGDNYVSTNHVGDIAVDGSITGIHAATAAANSHLLISAGQGENTFKSGDLLLQGGPGRPASGQQGYPAVHPGDVIVQGGAKATGTDDGNVHVRGKKFVVESETLFHSNVTVNAGVSIDGDLTVGGAVSIDLARALLYADKNDLDQSVPTATWTVLSWRTNNMINAHSLFEPRIITWTLEGGVGDDDPATGDAFNALKYVGDAAIYVEASVTLRILLLGTDKTAFVSIDGADGPIASGSVVNAGTSSIQAGKVFRVVKNQLLFFTAHHNHGSNREVTGNPRWTHVQIIQR